MQAQIVENAAIVSGKLAQVTTESDLSGFMLVVLHINSVQSSKNLPNFFTQGPGTDVQFYIRVSDVGQPLRAGDVISMLVRKAGPFRSFADGASIHVQSQ